MILNNNDASTKLAKLTQDPCAMQFGLTPEGFLLVSKSKTIEITDFVLYQNGRYCCRQGLERRNNLPLDPKGTFLCCHCNGKFIAPVGTDGFEYATGKKPLRPEFSFLLSFRFGDCIILLIADGRFADEAFMITLKDTAQNNQFVNALVRMLVEARDPAIAKAMFAEEGEARGEEN